MYTDAKVDGHSIKLILDSRLADSIITRQLMDQLGHRVDHTVSARIITANRATKTPIGEINDFSIEVNISWADINHNELLPILIWDNNDNGKEKQREKPIWEATIDTWTNNNQSEMSPILDWKEKNKEKGKEKEENILEKTTTAEEITSDWEREYSCEPIKEPLYISQMQGLYPKRQGKWNNKPCFTCGEQLLNERMWNDIPGRRGMCDTSCQYTILITISHLDGYLHDKDKIWQMVNAKVKSTSSSEILEIKNNPPEPTNIVLVLNLDVFIDLENSPEEFHEHY
ncbi:hypothetical protein G9A89_017411 [Geosiphon pyriformis]|nr:hypothetical protein G9A89_017411 [Geosiphon pyriformis]